MVTADYIMRSAASRVRAAVREGKSAAVALAFLRALGVQVSDPSTWGVSPQSLHASRYDSVAECFANRESPMDGRAQGL